MRTACSIPHDQPRTAASASAAHAAASLGRGTPLRAAHSRRRTRGRGSVSRRHTRSTRTAQRALRGTPVATGTFASMPLARVQAPHSLCARLGRAHLCCIDADVPVGLLRRHGVHARAHTTAKHLPYGVGRQRQRAALVLRHTPARAVSNQAARHTAGRSRAQCCRMLVVHAALAHAGSAASPVRHIAGVVCGRQAQVRRDHAVGAISANAHVARQLLPVGQLQHGAAATCGSGQ